MHRFNSTQTFPWQSSTHNNHSFWLHLASIVLYNNMAVEDCCSSAHSDLFWSDCNLEIYQFDCYAFILSAPLNNLPSVIVVNFFTAVTSNWRPCLYFLHGVAAQQLWMLIHNNWFHYEARPSGIPNNWQCRRASWVFYVNVARTCVAVLYLACLFLCVCWIFCICSISLVLIRSCHCQPRSEWVWCMQ